MLDEYILSQLDKIRQERYRLQEELSDLTEEETQCNKQIEKLLENEDVGLELFSPRAGNDTVKTKVADIQKHIEDLQYKQAAVTESLGENQERMTHYEKLLDEARNREPEQEENISDQEKEKKTQIFFEIENEDDLRTIYVGEMKMLLERIDKCINLVGHNRNQCKNELKNLRYHLRSIISEAENSKNQ